MDSIGLQSALPKLCYTDLLGAPFRYRGHGAADGYDCWTLTQEVQRRCGVSLPDYAYSDNPEQTFLSALIDGSIDEKYERLDRPEPFCMVLFSVMSGTATHIGTVLADCERFIHIMQRTSVTVERLNAPHWAKRIRGFYRWKS